MTFAIMYEGLQEEISNLPTSSHFIWSMQGVRSGSRTSPHLFQMHSEDDHLFSNCLVRPVTDIALGYYLSKYERKLPLGPHKLYKFLEREPKLSSTNSHMFQWACEKFFESLMQAHSFTVRSLDDPRKTTTWVYSGHISNYSSPKSISSRLRTQFQSGKVGKARSTYTTFPSFNNMVCISDGVSMEFVRMMTGVDCYGDAAGFERVQRWLNRSPEDSQHLQPSTKRPWKFIFIVPEEIATSFTKWTFGNGWDEKVAQYVLGLSRRQIWGC
jgi:hypothetical protein